MTISAGSSHAVATEALLASPLEVAVQRNAPDEVGVNRAES